METVSRQQQWDERYGSIRYVYLKYQITLIETSLDTIVVFLGILPVAENEDNLAAVLSHGKRGFPLRLML